MKRNRSVSKFRCIAVASLAVASSTAVAQAANYPSRPITIVVPFSAGGGVDAMARVLAEKLRTTLGQSVVIENKGGGSGMIGAQAVVKAQPDGYTLLMGSAGETAINPYVFKSRMQYAPQTDLMPISLVVKVPNVVVVNPSLPYKTIDELVAYAKTNPGKVRYGTSGVGNPQHLSGELMARQAGVQLTHVPYRGASNQLLDVIGGNIEMTFVSLAGARQFIKDGKVRAIGITSQGKSVLAPDIPAISDSSSMKGYSLENWFGLFAPKGTPAPVIARLNGAVVEALKDPGLSTRLRELGGNPTPMSPDQFAAFIKQDAAKFAKIVEDAKITPDN
ncbi:Tripartite-type tricarboxylate transporter, receptor component TctC [Ralstonia sp. 25mfcol4.1]|uniref:Bug family tripartite tricarboxylate transporter substrate binding protein n=1 Tax=Ralstonia sp. 25mfcol4.1 TaxID=1761899 RepID=UPI000884DD85|nr:tripartite tricarboxylate transporter substrate binding protein [Ralstonia sp. 25mfcol4.1]SDP81809.1 Tripartite-type tricarboxylate transporter, receptor component TctC [Ralstonia sp. 25mfcol4.1]